MKSYLLVTLVFFKHVVSQNIEINTPLGKILGTTLTTRLGKPIYAFRGVRYAKAPINELRFQPPVAVEAWSGIYNATEDGPVCPQLTNEPVSEDCLLLNVYTTKLPNKEDNPKHPIIVFFHPGGSHSGSSRSNHYGPQYLLDQDIVLVTLNYRLGSLGFISVGREAPGNNGYKDQVIALKWIQNNIVAFGGDPDSVTLYGYSASAWSVALHMVSPMSRGLFHKAIGGSGLSVGNFVLPSNQIDLAKRQAKLVGCSDRNVKEIMDCLKTKSAEELGKSTLQLREFGTNPTVLYFPIVEDDFGQERFLTDQPFNLISEGKFEKVPVMTGITTDELISRAFELSNASLLSELDDKFEKYAPICFGYNGGTKKSEEVSRSLRSYYFGNQSINNASLRGLAELYSDSLSRYPTYKIINYLTDKNSEPVYYYKFSYKSPYTHFYIPGTNVPYGVVHQDDLIYLFYMPPRFPLFSPSSAESKMVERLTSLWANFAKTGNPTDNGIELIYESKWTPYNFSSKHYYMDIGEKLVLQENLREETYSFWQKLFP